MTDPTLDPSRRSWVESANDPAGDFPVQNLPFCAFTAPDRSGARLGVAIGAMILDLRALAEAGLPADLDGDVRRSLQAPVLNDLLALGRPAWRAVRASLANLLDASSPAVRDDAALCSRVLIDSDRVSFTLPVEIGDYTDFYCSIHHATNVGSMFRPDNPLMPNYKHLPVGYHGRASSIVVGGTPVHRPAGQIVPVDGEPPIDAACRLLDYELEVGAVVGPGNVMGTRITMDRVHDHLFGLTLVNDWSARDIQKWEYQPLGPFNAKNFVTSLGPFVVTLDALEPFRVPMPPRGSDDPAVLPYLTPNADYGYDITLEVLLRSKTMREQGTAPMLVSRGNFRDMYWTMHQMLVHHTSTGCNMRPGDLIASGTVSGPTDTSRGCLLERTWRGTQPLDLPDGTQRKFLQDGDEVILRGVCHREGFARIGFGVCTGVVGGGESRK